MVTTIKICFTETIEFNVIQAAMSFNTLKVSIRLLTDIGHLQTSLTIVRIWHSKEDARWLICGLQPNTHWDI